MQARIIINRSLAVKSLNVNLGGKFTSAFVSLFYKLIEY